MIIFLKKKPPSIRIATLGFIKNAFSVTFLIII
jgi:hypothetical protein